MWGDKGIEPRDAQQGQIGNCWLIAAGMSIAENPKRIKDIFEIEHKNSASVYAAQMYLMGMPITVVVDDYIPLDIYDWSQSLYAKISKDGALWGTLYEKFFAKFFGNYEIIDAGGTAHGIEVSTGSPYKDWSHDKLDSDQIEDLWQQILDSETNGMMISSGSYQGNGSDQENNEVGLPYNHAFSVMKGLIATTASGEEHRLVQMRNPWGYEYFNGTWNDSSDIWTDELRLQLDHQDKDDGKFFMEYSDFIKYIDYTDLSMDVHDWNHAGFLFENDDEPVNRRAVFQDEPDSEFNIHKLLLKSSRKQKVVLQMHTYHWKHHHGVCEEAFL